MSLVDKPRIISAEVKKRNNYFKRDVGRPHISGELWVLTDKCSERTTRYVEVRDGQLLVFPAFSSRRLPEWRLPLYDLNLLPYPIGNPFCFSFSRRDHSIPVAVFQAQNKEDYDKWVRTLAAELICQTPFDHVRFLDILGITASLQQHEQTPWCRDTSKERAPDLKNMCLLKEKQQNMINSVVQSSFVKNCFRFKTNVHRKYESHRKNRKDPDSKQVNDSRETRTNPESDSEKENNSELDEKVRKEVESDIKSRVENQSLPKKGQASYLHSFYRKMSGKFSEGETKADSTTSCRAVPFYHDDLPDVVKDLPCSETGLKAFKAGLVSAKHSDLKANYSCPNLKYSDSCPQDIAPVKYVRKTLSSCSECDSDDSTSTGFRFQSVSNLLARCQESENYVPVKDKLMLFESLCSSSETKDHSLNKLKSRSLHDLGRVEDDHFELDSRKCQYHSSVTNICGSERLKQREQRKGSNSNLVKNICRYFEHRTSGSVKLDQSQV